MRADMNPENKNLTPRERIMARVRANHPQPTAHPEVPIYPIAGDALENFITHVKGFDGEIINTTDRAEALRWLHKNVSTEGKEAVFSAINGFEGNITLEELPRPSDAHRLHASVGEGLLGIGETGSVLVTPETFGRMSNGLLAINLYLLLDRKKIVAGLQEAYSHINLSETQYSSLFSGPSATADIEAVHVTGAQGAVSLTVILYG